MANLLEQAIDCNDRDRAAKIIKTPSASRTQRSPIAFPKYGQVIARGARA